jgi:hypothetical protein
MRKGEDDTYKKERIVHGVLAPGHGPAGIAELL